jgi:hypothetical protein
MVTLTATDLLKMSHDELDELFRASPAGPIPMVRVKVPSSSRQIPRSATLQPSSRISSPGRARYSILPVENFAMRLAPLVRTLFGPRSTTRRAGSIRNKRSSLTTARPRYWHIGYAMRFASSSRASI